MNITQTAPKPASTVKIWEDASPLAAVGDVIRKAFCPIARIIGKEILKDGRTCLIVTFPGCHDRHIEEWAIEPAIPATPEPATLSAEKTAPVTSPAPTAAAIGEDDTPPNCGDNGRGRVNPIAPKKLLPSIVPVKRITSDIPASNFDPFELEILGELSLLIGGFVVPPVLVRDSGGYRVVSGHIQYHAAVLARRLNPRAGEAIPAIVLEPENQATALAQLKRLKFVA